MRGLISIVLVVFATGCVATTARTRRLSLGMGKQEVLKVMGSPTSVKAKDNEEVLEYLLWPTWSPSIYDKKTAILGNLKRWKTNAIWKCRGLRYRLAFRETRIQHKY